MLETTSSNQGVTVTAPAKVNLTLRVLGLRPDGYHDLESVVAAVNLFDTLAIEPAGALRLTCRGADVPGGEDNLVMKAARLLAGECGVRQGAHVRLEKRIPAGRGFGGGSSDAAAAMAGLNVLWKCGLATGELAVLGARLGSDVPLFFGPGVSIMRGRGEHLEAVSARLPWPVVLAWPYFGLPTGKVYRAYDRLPPPAGGRPEATQILDHLAGPAREAGPFLANDLEPAAAAVREGRMDVRAILRRAGAAAVGMTGSGSAYFALADSEAEATHVAAAARAAGAEATTALFLGETHQRKETPS